MFPRNTQVLKLDAGGRPLRWITIEDAASLYCAEKVAWEAGETAFVMHGGQNARSGRVTVLPVSSILAVSEPDPFYDLNRVPALTNAALFRRDQNLCLYCGFEFRFRDLTRDHIMPRSRGGPNTWDNVATACRRCNLAKRDRTPEEWGQELIALPFVPNHAEHLLLTGRRVLADQMAFLKKWCRRR